MVHTQRMEARLEFLECRYENFVKAHEENKQEMRCVLQEERATSHTQFRGNATKPQAKIEEKRSSRSQHW